MRLRASSLDALREREFRLLFTGQIVSLLGDQMVTIALAFAVLDLTGSVSALGWGGAAVGGALVAGVGRGWAIAVDAASLGVSAFFLSLLRLPVHVPLPPQSFLRDLREGWREFSSRTWVWVIVVAASIGNMMSGWFIVLGAAIAKSDLGGAGAWALILSSLAAGSLIGGLVALHVRPRRPLY